MPYTEVAPTRTNSGWLSAPENKVLSWLAPLIPSCLTPDRLTGLGFAAAVAALVGYLLAAEHPSALWIVNAALVVNWLGDSLDGRVARIRRIERPQYGFFLDQSVDVVSQLLFAVGLAASTYIRAEIVMLGFASYLMMTVQSLLRVQITGLFHLASAGIGLTEVRCLLFVANTLFYFFPPSPFQLGGATIAYPDLLGLIWIVVNVVLYVSIMVKELRRVSLRDPAPSPRSATTSTANE